MNKVFNINLGGYPYTIDEDAYARLTSYLETIGRHFQEEEGVEEIVSDIEFRMAELFNEQLKHKQIVTQSDVESAIKVMGTPEEFGAASGLEGDSFDESQQEEEGIKIKTGRKLFRDEDDSIVGGVAAGLAAYFGIENPFWVRLAFFLFTISGGFGIPLYLILWAIIPSAKTTSDRLAMRGERINVSNIARTIGDEMNNISEKISDFGEGIGAKKKSFGAAAAIKNGSNALKRLIQGIFKIIASIWRPIALFIGTIALIALAIAWISMIVGFTASFPYVKLITGSGFIASLGVVNLFFVIGVPLLTIVFLVLKFAFNNKISRGVLGIAWGIWFINVISLGIVTAETFKGFNQSGEITNVKSFAIEGDTLRIESKKSNPASLTSFGPLSKDGNQFYSNDVRFNMVKTDGNEFIIEETYSSRGNSSKAAQELANGIQHDLAYNNGILTYGDGFALDKKSDWKNQQVKITIKVPKDKKVLFLKGTNKHLNRINTRHNNEGFFMDFKQRDSLWFIRMDHPNCTICHKKNNGRFELSNFSKIFIDGKIETNIERSNHSQLYIRGHDNNQRHVSHEIKGDSLFIKRKDGFDGNIRIYIKTPFLDAFDGHQTDDVSINGFDETSMDIKLNSFNELRLRSNVQHLSLDLKERSRIHLSGKGKVLKASLSGKSKINGQSFQLSKAFINAQDASQAALYVRDTLYQRVDEKSIIETRGDQVIKLDLK